MSYKNDTLLIEALRQGDERAFLYIIDIYNQRLFGYALTLTHDHAMAEDILQNVFLKTWEGRKKLFITSSMQNYLFKSIYNEFVNQYKKNKLTLRLEKKYLENLEHVILTPDESSWDRIIARIMEEIQHLPPKCREIFILSRKEGLTNLEISEHLHISIKTVEAQISKAFIVLRERIGKKYRSILFLLFNMPRANKIRG